MSFVDIRLVDGVFPSPDRQEMAKSISDVMLMMSGPRSLLETLSRWKALYERVDGHPPAQAALVAPTVPAIPGSVRTKVPPLQAGGGLRDAVQACIAASIHGTVPSGLNKTRVSMQERAA